MELRTHNCGELRDSDVGKQVKLCGWLSSIRDLGAVIFFVLRDYYGYTQVVVADEDKNGTASRNSPRKHRVGVGKSRSAQCAQSRYAHRSYRD